jgi:hypothetical protein
MFMSAMGNRVLPARLLLKRAPTLDVRPTGVRNVSLSAQCGKNPRDFKGDAGQDFSFFGV